MNTVFIIPTLFGLRTGVWVGIMNMSIGSVGILNMIIGSVGILIGLLVFWNDELDQKKWLVLWTFSVGILKRRYWYFDSACWYFDRVCWYFDRVCWYFDSLVFWTLVFWTPSHITNTSQTSQNTNIVRSNTTQQMQIVWILQCIEMLINICQDKKLCILARPPNIVHQ